MLARILLGILYTASGLAIIGTIVLHNYARITCHWNWDSKESFMRMVVFADPQMEGDAKIRRLGKRAHVDLAFNDAYMRHIYKKMMSPSWEPFAHLSSLLSRSTTHTPRSPTHVSILGDLFSSQWIDDTEFDVRVARYRSIFPDPSLSSSGSVARTVGTREESTAPLMINITGNHDIGYGYDISQNRVERWEQVFGKSNFISSLDIPTSSVVGSENDTDSRRSQSSRRLHLVVLNTMLLDGPSSDENLRGQTWEFLQEASSLKENNPHDKVVLLTHIPFHKEQGICVDPPDIRVHWDNTIIEQTMLTPNTTQWILNTLQPDFVLNGHDHYGCDVVHTLHHGQDTWIASATDLSLPVSSSSQAEQQQQQQEEEVKEQRQQARRVREVTQRSMMAEFGGYSGLFEIKIPSTSSSTPFDNSNTNIKGEDELEFHYTACGFFNDLQVWVVIITDLVVVILWGLFGLLRLITSSLASSGQARKKTHASLPSEKQKLL